MDVHRLELDYKQADCEDVYNGTDNYRKTDGTIPRDLRRPADDLVLEEDLSVTDFNLGKTVGTGSFGRVRFVAHKATENYYALKILKKSAIIRLKQVEHVIHEKDILKNLKHPFIVNLFGLFQDNRFLYFVLEYVCGGEFFSHLRKVERFDNKTTRFFAAQIASIFVYCHSKDTIYRDLKPENILLAQDGYVKLADFGFAKVVVDRTYTLCGTSEYIAPEVLLNKGHGKPVDWWTLGILIYEMMFGNPPFIDDNPMIVYQKILSEKISFPSFFDTHAKHLVKHLLVGDLKKRYGGLKGGVDDILKHPWFVGKRRSRASEKNNGDGGRSSGSTEWLLSCKRAATGGSTAGSVEACATPARARTSTWCARARSSKDQTSDQQENVPPRSRRSRSTQSSTYKWLSGLLRSSDSWELQNKDNEDSASAAAWFGTRRTMETDDMEVDAVPRVVRTYTRTIDFDALYRKEYASPYIPTVESATCTDNFEDYPDSDELPSVVNQAVDPFGDWSMF
eukprot:GEMP01036946.1.p1 GENE.GEMP01036946.1~~GEMP01036946.1.p1  ORF type:complete len:508 (+),score=109.41 GEMP01036946.1:275-1798(+)